MWGGGHKRKVRGHIKKFSDATVQFNGATAILAA